MSFKSHLANSLVEYTLPLAVVGITIYGLLNNGLFDENLKQFTQTTNNGSMKETQLDIDRVGNVDMSQLQTDADLKQYYLIEGISFVEGNTACFGDAGCLTIPNIRGGAVAEVDGTLGGRTISQYSKMLLEMAKNMKERGAPDDLASRIERLGKTGMSMGATMLAVPRGNVHCGSNCDDYYSPGGSVGHLLIQKSNLLAAFNSYKAELNQYFAKNPGMKEAFGSASPIVDMASANINQAAKGWSVDTNEDHWVYSPTGRLVQSNATTICQTVNGNTSCPTVKKK